MNSAEADTAEALYREAQAECRNGRFAAGADLARRALAVDPKLARAHLLLGMALMQLGDAKGALASFDSAVACEPGLGDAYGNRGDALVSLGRLPDAVASYDRAIALAPGAVENWINRGAVLVDLERYADALVSYDRAVTLVPDAAEVHFSRAIVLRALGREEEAIGSLDRTLALDPNHVAALINRGSAQFKLERFEDAHASFAAAVRLRPDDVDALYNLGFTLGALHRHAEALATYERLLTIKPGHLDALLNHGTELQQLHRTRDALASYAKIVAIQPDHVEARLNEAFARLASGDFRGGWATLEWRLRKPGFEERQYAQPSWRGREPITGKTLLVYGEQGLGDSINMVRYVPLLARQGARVILDVPPPLQRLLSQVDGAALVAASGELLPPFDFHCPLMSLPLAFGTGPGTIPADVPYLTAAPERAAAWAARLPAAGGLRVGVNWCGNPAFADDRRRSMKLDQFAPVLKLAGVDFVSLNPGIRHEDAARLAGMPHVSHLASDFRDFADTAAVIAGIDLILTTDTAIAHLAGAMAKPVWIMVSSSPDWRWAGEGETTRWYPTARLFRQPVPGDWAAVLEKVLRELAALSAGRSG